MNWEFLHVSAELIDAQDIELTCKYLPVQIEICSSMEVAESKDFQAVSGDHISARLEHSHA